MANRATKFVSAIVVSAVLGIPVSTFAKDGAVGLDASMPDSTTLAASSATECLTAPNRDSTPGQHWFYRMEPGTNRRCWFLREQAERTSQTASPRSTPSQSPFPDVTQALPAATPPPPKTFSRNAQPQRALSNARAEVGPRSTGMEGPTVPKTPIFITTGSAGNRGASVGTDTAQGQSAVLSSSEPTDASITGSTPDAMAADGPNTSFGLNTGLSPPVSEMPAMANMPQEKASASLQVLFLVILGALAFAGVIASLIHRMPRIWRRHARLRRRSAWPGIDGGRRGSSVTAASSGRNQDRRPAAAQRDDHSGQIKRFLTQITKQAGGQSKKRGPAKSQAGSAARVRTPSTRRGARASAVRP